MAWDEYIAIRNSDLYEGRGLAKPLLTLIGMLVFGAPEEGQKPDPDQGFCVASQEYLACELGCSEPQIKRLIKEFKKDGWLCVHSYRDKDGHPHNKYSFPRSIMQKIRERKRKKDENKKWIREKNLNMRRADNGKRFTKKDPGFNLIPGMDDDENFDGDVSSGQIDTRLGGKLIPSLGANSAQASGQIAPIVSSFRESYQTDLQKAPVTKRENERDIESESSPDGHTHVSNRENFSVEVSPEPPQVRRPRIHIHNFNPGNSRCTGCEFECNHPNETTGTVKRQFVSVCKDCRVVLEDVPA